MELITLKSSRELDAMRKAGRIAAQARELAGRMVAPGVTTLDIDTAVRKFIESQGAKPSFLGYGGFSGSACISVNDVVIHLATSAMGFGGVGESGMGAYHGRVGFETFSHRKSIVDKKTWMDLPMRYQPYLPLHEKLIRRCVSIVCAAAECDAAAATAALEQCGYHPKIAIVMLLCGCTAEEAEKRLAEKDGYIARVVG